MSHAKAVAQCELICRTAKIDFNELTNDEYAVGSTIETRLPGVGITVETFPRRGPASGDTVAVKVEGAGSFHGWDGDHLELNFVNVTFTFSGAAPVSRLCTKYRDWPRTKVDVPAKEDIPKRFIDINGVPYPFNYVPELDGLSLAGVSISVVDEDPDKTEFAELGLLQLAGDIQSLTIGSDLPLSIDDVCFSP